MSSLAKNPNLLGSSRKTTTYSPKQIMKDTLKAINSQITSPMWLDSGMRKSQCKNYRAPAVPFRIGLISSCYPR
jgi:hypothetical protein